VSDVTQSRAEVAVVAGGAHRCPINSTSRGVPTGSGGDRDSRHPGAPASLPGGGCV